MKIKKSELNKNLFSELEKGDVFQYQDTLFMVIEEIEDASYNFYNAVSIEKGELACFEDTDEVTKIEGHFQQE